MQVQSLALERSELNSNRQDQNMTSVEIENIKSSLDENMSQKLKTV